MKFTKFVLILILVTLGAQRLLASCSATRIRKNEEACKKMWIQLISKLK